MSTFALTNPETPGVEPSSDERSDRGTVGQEPSQADDFSILEQRVLRAVQLLKSEREARATAEGNATTLQQLLDEQSVQLADTVGRLRALEQEREQVRSRVERMMKQLDEISG